jgi:hypothetical protein
MRHARCTECNGDSRANMSKLRVVQARIVKQ